MTREDLTLGSLPPELAPLVEAEQFRPGAPEEVRRKIALGLAGGLAAGAVSSTASASVPGLTGLAGASATSGITLKVVLVVGTLTIGSGAGLVASRVLSPARSEISASLEPLAVPPLSPPAFVLPTTGPDSDPLGTYLDLSDLDEVPVPTRHHQKQGVSRGATPPTTLPVPVPVPSGRQLLREAQAHLRSGVPDQALDLLDRHERTFPSSKLAEEREALRILALRSAGEGEAATSRGLAFLERYPESLFQAAIQQALASDGSSATPPTQVRRPR